MSTGPQNLENISQHADWNEDLARKYDGFEDWHRKSWFPIRFVESRRVRDVLENLHISSPQHKVLDVGCGPGIVLAQIPQGELHGIDLSQHLAEMARERLGDRAEIKHANAEEIPYESDTFDAVFCTEVLEHTLHPEVVVAECVRVLKPGGHLVLSVPNEKIIDFCKGVVRFIGLGRVLSKGGPDGSEGRTGHEWHLHYLHGRDLTGWATEAGAVEARHRGSPFFFLPLHFIVTARKPAS
jgi:2-polyprenyl-3-methyl-5-hydroxy-6-metoxy-1,4-benzoquinol methylase